MRLDAPVAAPYWERWSSTSRSPTIPSVSRHGSSMTTLLRPLCPVARSLPSVSSPPLPSCWWGASPRSWPRSPTHGTDGGLADTPSARRPGRRPRARPRRTRRRATGQRGDALRRIGHELLRSARPCLRSRPCLPGDIPDPSRRLYPTHLGGCSLGFGKVVERGSTHLAGITAREVCRAVGLSEWTMRRRFSTATGMSWRRYLLEARLLRSMALLVEPGSTVLNVSMTVGFDSVSAFRARSGPTPARRPRPTGDGSPRIRRQGARRAETRRRHQGRRCWQNRTQPPRRRRGRRPRRGGLRRKHRHGDRPSPCGHTR